MTWSSRDALLQTCGCVQILQKVEQRLLSTWEAKMKQVSARYQLVSVGKGAPCTALSKSCMDPIHPISSSDAQACLGVC